MHHPGSSSSSLRHGLFNSNARVRLITRRLCCLLALTLVKVHAKPNFGGEEWMRRFHAFIKGAQRLCNCFR
jgi:hypothetical protein